MKKAFVGIVAGLLLVTAAMSGYARAEDQDTKWWPWPNVEYRNMKINPWSGTWGSKILWTVSAPIETKQGTIEKSHSASYTATASASMGLKDIFGVEVSSSFTETLSTTVTLEAGWSCTWEAWTVGTIYSCSADKYVDGKYVGQVTAGGRSPERIDDKVTFRKA